MAKFAGDSCNSCSSPWTWEENKQFEVYLAKFPDDTPDLWHIIAKLMPSRTPLELKLRYDKLLLDVADIEAARVELPWPLQEDDEEDDDQEHVLVEQDVPTSCAGVARTRKGVLWIEEEHRQFLIGLEKYGKGDWRSISRYVVITKSPTQVGSHAQKYFLRQSASKEKRKRSSIHDVTTAREPLDKSFTRGSMN